MLHTHVTCTVAIPRISVDILFAPPVRFCLFVFASSFSLHPLFTLRLFTSSPVRSTLCSTPHVQHIPFAPVSYRSEITVLECEKSDRSQWIPMRYCILYNLIFPDGFKPRVCYLESQSFIPDGFKPRVCYLESQSFICFIPVAK